MTIDPENYLDTANNPTWQGIMEMQTTLDGKVAFVWRLRKMVRFAFVCNGVRFLSNSKERCL